jgi:hypothetical protein
MAIIIQVLQSSVFQFLMAILGVSAGKSTENWADAVAKYLPRIQWAMEVVAVVQLIMFVNNSLQYLKSIASNMQAVALTSQVCATTANLIEWRSCLAFSAKWHKCSVQGAYVLWQKKRSGVPAWPASQRMQLETGQPLPQLDQFMADIEWPEIRLQILQIDSGLSVAHENHLLMTMAQQQFSPAIQANILKWEKVYQKWCQIAIATNNFNIDQYQNQLQKAIKHHVHMIEWEQPAFHMIEWKAIKYHVHMIEWKETQSTVPACPASQRMQLPIGQSMSQLDQFIADSEWPVTKMHILEIDSCLSVAHENWLLMTAAKKQFSDAAQASILQWEAVYQQWCQTATATSGFDLKQFPTDVMKAVENHYSSMKWDAVAFKFE